MQPEPPRPLPPPAPSTNWMRTSSLLKIFIVGLLGMLLLIPASMVQSLITEREATRAEAVREVSAKWGDIQIIGGPVLSVPFTQDITDEKGRVMTNTFYAHALPDDLTLTGTVQPERRNRGIYSIMLYNTRLNLRATLRRPSAQRLGIPESRMQWDKAFVSIGITDMKGVRDTIRLRVNGQTLTVEPGIPTADVLPSGVNALLPANATSVNLECTLNLNGSTELSFLPFGKQTTVTLTSPWASPSFTGAYLPDQREVRPDGFKATWKVLQYNRNYPQQGVDQFLRGATSADAQPSASLGYVYDNTAFGVKLLLPVDEYQKTTRSAKYAVMFILITFTAFFFVEILNRQRIHPIQYLLVGFAICLFYLLLLAISEHLSFNKAYLIGTVVVLAMVAFYVRYVFKNVRLTVLFTAALALLYGFFYSLLQLEDYALLLGSLGLALILATIMYLTRNVNWYNAYENASE